MICKKCNTETNDIRKSRRVCRSCEREAARRNSFKYIRGITHEDRDALLKQQDGKCAACGSIEPGPVKGWHVDHSHKTNGIRGILCATCNIALGQVNDSVERLEHLIKYLGKFND